MPKENKILSVPQRIFETYLIELEKKGVPVDVTARLKSTLFVDNDVSVDALREALFSNGNYDV